MRLVIKIEAEYRRACAHLQAVWIREKDRGGISLEVLPFVEPITPPQRGKLYVVIDELSAETGSEALYLRNYFERSYGPTLDGNPKPMAEYSKAEASAMIERVIQVAAEQGYSIR